MTYIDHAAEAYQHINDEHPVIHPDIAAALGIGGGS